MPAKLDKGRLTDNNIAAKVCCLPLGYETDTRTDAVRLIWTCVVRYSPPHDFLFLYPITICTGPANDLFSISLNPTSLSIFDISAYVMDTGFMEQPHHPVLYITQL